MPWNISKVIVTGETDLKESGLFTLLTERMVKLTVVDIMNNEQERERMEENLLEMKRQTDDRVDLLVYHGEFADIQFLNHILR